MDTKRCLVDSYLICVLDSGVILEYNIDMELIWRYPELPEVLKTKAERKKKQMSLILSIGVERLTDGTTIAVDSNNIYLISEDKDVLWLWDGKKQGIAGRGFHDIHVTPDKTLLVSNTLGDEVLEVNMDKDIVWRWPIPPDLYINLKRYNLADNTHVNHAMWYDTDKVLVSIGAYGLLVVVDKSTGAVVWKHVFDDFIHNPCILPNGNILATVHNYIAEINLDGTEVWSFHNKMNVNFTDADWLPNNNVLVTLRDGKSVAEVTWEGDVVFEFLTHVGRLYECDAVINGTTLWKEKWWKKKKIHSLLG